MKFKILLAAVLLSVSSWVDAKDLKNSDVFSITEFAGKVVYVDFWASWCGPCRASFPFMAELSEQYGDDLVIVAVNVDEQRKDATDFLASFDAPFEVVYDPTGDIASFFEVPGMPTSYLYDREGNFIERHIGFRTANKEKIRETIESAIAR